MKTTCVTFLVILCTHLVMKGQPQLTARGKVYHDVNNNGICDKREPGIASVAVSNGADVVLTNALGQYEISVANDNIIFVIKPSGYQYPLNGLNQPQFYYNHKPDGSPKLKYKGVDATGPLPPSIDFGLRSCNNSDNFSIVLMSDPQPYTMQEVDYYNIDIVEELAGTKDFAFGLTLGDLVGDNLDLFTPLNQATSRIGIPWLNVIGNHDMNFDAKEATYADETFERTYGPSSYAFNHGNVHFIMLNDIIYPNPYTSHSYVGGLSESQFRFIENTLKYVPDDYLVVLGMHIPIYNEIQYGETFLNDHRKRLFDLLKDRRFTLSLSGHTHSLRHYYFGSEEGWRQQSPHHHYTTGTASGDWWSGKLLPNGVPESTMYDGTPNGYSIIQFNGNQYTIEYKAAGESADYKMRIYGPRKVPQNKYFRGEFYVNYFEGGSKDVVEYSINNGEWKRMRYTVEPDPFVYAILYEWDSAEQLPAGVRPSNPVTCYHLWKARVPTKLPLGRNIIDVRVSNGAGTFHTGQFTFTVEAIE